MRLAGIKLGTVHCCLLRAGTGYVLADTGFAVNRAGPEQAACQSPAMRGSWCMTEPPGIRARLADPGVPAASCEHPAGRTTCACAGTC